MALTNTDPISHDLVRLAKSNRKRVEIIHRAGCPYVRDVVPWLWAEGRPVNDWLGLSWFRPCSHCKPHEDSDA